MNDLAARLKEAREDAKLSQTQLARRVGCGQSLIGNLESRSQKNSTIVPKLAAELGVNALWLSEGKGPKRFQYGQAKESDAIKRHENIEPVEAVSSPLPLISWVQAGAWCEVIDNFVNGEAEEWIPCPVQHGPRAYVLRVRGESMLNPMGWPSFRDGDLIFVDPDRTAVNGSLVVVRLEDSKEATFKRLIVEGEQKYLKVLNPAWPDPVMRINGNATLCGVVIGKLERF